MAGKKVRAESRGEVFYDESIVESIVDIALRNVEGVCVPKPKKGKAGSRDYVKLVNEKEGIYVSVTVDLVYGYSVPDVAYNIQRGIRQNVESMTKYRISKIDVFVSDVNFDEKPAVVAEN